MPSRPLTLFRKLQGESATHPNIGYLRRGLPTDADVDWHVFLLIFACHQTRFEWQNALLLKSYSQASWMFVFLCRKISLKKLRRGEARLPLECNWTAPPWQTKCAKYGRSELSPSKKSSTSRASIGGWHHWSSNLQPSVGHVVEPTQVSNLGLANFLVQSSVTLKGMRKLNPVLFFSFSAHTPNQTTTNIPPGLSGQPRFASTWLSNKATKRVWVINEPDPLPWHKGRPIVGLITRVALTWWKTTCLPACRAAFPSVCNFDSKPMQTLMWKRQDRKLRKNCSRWTYNGLFLARSKIMHVQSTSIKELNCRHGKLQTWKPRACSVSLTYFAYLSKSGHHAKWRPIKTDPNYFHVQNSGRCSKASSDTGTIMHCRGESQKGHLPPWVQTWK